MHFPVWWRAVSVHAAQGAGGRPWQEGAVPEPRLSLGTGEASQGAGSRAAPQGCCKSHTPQSQSLGAAPGKGEPELL